MRLSRPLFARTLAAASLAAALSCTTFPAFADNDHGQATASVAIEQARQQAADHTQALMALQKRWEKAQGSDKSRALEQMIAKAEERRAFLLELMETNLAEVLRVAIPEDKQIGMPAEVVEKLETKLELEGEYEARYEDYQDGSHKLRHFLKTPFGEHFELRTTEHGPTLRSGSAVRVVGVLFPDDSSMSDTDGVVATTDDNILTLALGGGETGGSNDGTVDIASNTFGDQRTLVILVNFQDKQEQPYTKAQTESVIFGDVSDFFYENSYGQTTLSGDVAGWYTIPVSSTSCNTSDIAYHAKSAAENSGINVSTYSRLVYAFPENACGFSGTATVGGQPSQAWIRGNFDLKVVGHELGHNFGLHHSHSLVCSDGSIIGAGNPIIGYGTDPWPSCSSLEYGDKLDIMGASDSMHVNSGQKETLGWLNYGSSPAITTVTASGTYELTPYAANDNGTKALKILKSEDPVTGYQTWYYVEYRQPIGFDSWITSTSRLDADNILNGVVVHAKYGNSKNWLLDMTPETYQLYSEDPALVEGRSFTSPEGDLTISTIWTDSDKAQVDVSFDGGTTATCSRANPSLTLSPGQSDWVAAGTAYTYTVTVTNNDSSACSGNSYNLSAAIPSGWNSSFSKSSLSLSPGASASADVTVTSASSAGDGFYDFTVTGASGSYSANATATYVVSNTLSNSAPVAQDDSAETSEGTAVTINVLANDSDPDGDALNVTSVSGVNGSAKINSDGTITFTPAAGFSGTETFSYAISDGNGGSASANVAVTVNAISSNQAPVANDDSASTNENTAVTIRVMGNDSDPDGDALKITVVTQGNKGSVTVNSDGTVTYSPAKNFKSADTFSYTVSDGSLSASATVTVSPTSGDSSSGPGNGHGNGKNK